MFNPNYLEPLNQKNLPESHGIKTYCHTQITVTYQLCAEGMLWVASMLVTPAYSVHVAFPCKPTRKQLSKAFKKYRNTRKFIY